MSALKQAIADANDEGREDVFVPEWNVTLQVRTMSGHDRAALARRIADGDAAAMLFPELIITTTYDPETGEKVFEDTPEDRDLILSKNAVALDRVAKLSMRMSGLSDEAEAEVGKPS